MPTRSPTRQEAIETVREAIMRDIHVAKPCVVQRYDATTQLCDVQPLIGDQFQDEDDGWTQVPCPIVTNVPVSWARGGGYSATMPLAPGDTGMIIMSDRSLDTWLEQGGMQNPTDQRRHEISDAFFVPGIHPKTDPIPSVPTDGAFFGHSGGVGVKVTAGDLQLGGADDYAATAAKVLAQLNALKTAIQGWTPVPNDGGAALKTALTTLFSTWPGSMASSIVKVKS